MVTAVQQCVEILGSSFSLPLPFLSPLEPVLNQEEKKRSGDCHQMSCRKAAED